MILVLYLIVRCGEDAKFMDIYWKLIGKFKINTLVIYNSANCLPLLDLNSPIQDPKKKNAYSYFYKIIPIDSSNNINNYANYSELLLSMLKSNQSDQTENLSSFSHYLDENEAINFIKNYNGSNEVFFQNLNHRIGIKCFENTDNVNSILFEYCYRDFHFKMFGVNQLTNKYTEVATFYLKNLIFGLNSNNNIVKIEMPKNLTFKYQGTLDLNENTSSKLFYFTY